MAPARHRTVRNSRLSQHLLADKRTKQSFPILTGGELFPDGGGLDLVRDADGQAALLLFDGRNHQVARRVETRCRTFEPLQVHPSTLRAMILPTRCAPYRSTRELFTEVSGLFSGVIRLPESFAVALTFIIFATWLVDVLPIAPLLWVVVPSTSSAHALTQLLRLLCRRALFVADLSIVGLRALPMELKPTILADVSTVTRGLVKVIRASNHPNAYVPIGHQIADLFGAKIIFANQPLPDPAAAGFPFEIVLDPMCEYVTPMNRAAAQRVADEFQPKLLTYRLSNHNKVKTPCLNLKEFTAPARALAEALAACIVDDEELQGQIVPILKPHDRQIQVDLTAILESIVLEALLAACHGANVSIVPVADLTQSVNTIFAGRGDSQQVSAEIVGWKLRGLGLRTDFIAGGRKGLTLTGEIRTRIHTLAAAYGVRTLRLGVIDGVCPDCARLSSPSLKRTVG